MQRGLLGKESHDVIFGGLPRGLEWNRTAVGSVMAPEVEGYDGHGAVCHNRSSIVGSFATSFSQSRSACNCTADCK